MRLVSGLLAIFLLWAVPALADITTNLTLWWPLDDGSGTSATDSSGNGRTGTLVNGPAWTITCQVNGCLTLTNTSLQVVTNATAFSSLLSGTDGTMAAWVKLMGTPRTAGEPYDLDGVIADSSGYLGITVGIATAHGSLDRLWIWNYDGTITLVGVPYTVGTWIHVAWVHTGGNLLAYANGTLVTSVSSGTTANLAGTVRVGGNYTAAYLEGLVDEIRMYSRALSAGDILALYQYSPSGAHRQRPLFLP